MRRTRRGASPARSSSSPIAANRGSSILRSSQDCFDTFEDALPLIRETFQPALSLGGGDVVHARAPFDSFLAAANQAALLEKVKRGIQHAFANDDAIRGEQADRTGQLVAIHFASGEQPQD